MGLSDFCRRNEPGTTADRAGIVARYKHLRAVGQTLSHKLVQRLSKDVLHEGGRKLGLLKKDILVFDSEDETAILMDYCIYDVRRQGRNDSELRKALVQSAGTIHVLAAVARSSRIVASSVVRSDWSAPACIICVNLRNLRTFQVETANGEREWRKRKRHPTLFFPKNGALAQLLMPALRFAEDLGLACSKAAVEETGGSSVFRVAGHSVRGD